jgi:cell division protein FtsI/penicillin-binding protein 2
METHRMLARTDSRARALVLLVVAALLATGIGARLVWWHVLDSERLVVMAHRQLDDTQEVAAERGEIRDANGILLATSVELQSIFATPNAIDLPRQTAWQLASILGLDPVALGDEMAKHDPWMWVDRRVDPQKAERIKELDLEGIGMLPETKRVYPVKGASPNTTIAAQVLGFVNVDGEGRAGIEYAEDSLLAGQAGEVVAQEDVAGHRIADSVVQLQEPQDGSDLTLTIDAGLQNMLEAKLWDTYKKNYAHGVTGVVMDVHTGAIKAMASFPSFDANTYAQTDPELFKSPAVTRAYEPGSVMKAFTIAAALDAGAITTTDTFDDNNDLVVGKVHIHNADRYTYAYGHGPITAGQVLELSNNVGAAHIGLTLGGEKLYDAFKRYGFGQRTGIEIAGEATGLVWDPNDPQASGKLTTAQNSFGQGLTVTAVQLVAGYAAIANGGTLVNPHLVAGWTDAAGTYHPTEPAPGERIMREETADTVLRLLTGAVDNGIAKLAKVPGYSIAGKTGTAEVAGPVQHRVRDGVDANGKPKYKTITRSEYIPGWIDSSFIGVMPASDPQLVTLILMHRPATWGRYAMVERPDQVFSVLAPQMLDYLAIPPDRSGEPVAAK